MNRLFVGYEKLTSKFRITFLEYFVKVYSGAFVLSAFKKLRNGEARAVSGVSDAGNDGSSKFAVFFKFEY